MTDDTIALPNPMSGRWLRRTRAAWYVAVLLVLVIVILAIPGYIRTVPGGLSVIEFAVNPAPVVIALNAFSALISIGATLLALALAFLLFRRRPTDRMALFLSFYLLAFGVLTGPIEMLGRLTHDFDAIYILNVILFILILFPATCFLLSLFPDGRFTPEWSRWLAVASLVIAPVTGIGYSTWIGSESQPMAALVISSILAALVTLGAFYAQFYRFRHIASDQQRQQIKWVVYGLAVMLAVQMAVSVPYYWSFSLPAGTTYPVWLALSAVLYVLSFAALPLSLTIAVMRHRLYDIDLLINRTLVYGGLSLLIASLYVLTIAGVGAAVQHESNLISLLLTTLLALVLFKPLRGGLQRGANRLVPIEAGLPTPRTIRAQPPEPSPFAPAPPTVIDDAPDTALISWSAQKRSAVRAAWYAVAILVLAFLILAIPGYIEAIPGGFSVVEFAPNPSPTVLAINVFSALISLATALLSFILAVLLFRRRPTDRMALFLSFYLLGFGLFSGAFEVADPIPVVGATSFLWNLLTNLIIFPASCFLFLLFPDGRFAPAWARRLAYASLIAAPMNAISFVVWSVSESRSIAFLAISSVLPVAILLGVLYAQFYRYRHIASGPQKQQIKWFVYGVGIMVFIMVATGVPYFWSFTLPTDTPYPVWLAFSTALYFLAFAALPLSLTIAVMRHRLYEIDLLINRTLVYGALSAIVIGLYVVAVGSLSLLFQIRNNLVISLLVTGLVAVLFQPMREWLQTRVNRVLFGERDNPVILLARLGEQIEANVALGELLKGILETVSKSLKLPYAAVELSTNNTPVTAAEYGRALQSIERIPLVSHGKQIGHLIVSPRSPGHTFSDDEKRLLENIARQTGTAVYAGQLYADLRTSRQQIVTAREEERRRLRRDLHDGLGPTMASQTLKLDAAMDLISGDPATGEGKDLTEATRLLMELKEQTQASVKNIRRLVYALRPPALDDLGLLPAIQAHIEQQARSLGRLHVTVNATPVALPPLPAAVEVVVYRIVLEAFTNVIRHARAETCHIYLSVSEEPSHELQLKIIDDGRGIAGDVEYGVGIQAMRERTEEVGGSFRVASEHGRGTRVWASIPLLGSEK